MVEDNFGTEYFDAFGFCLELIMFVGDVVYTSSSRIKTNY